MQDRELPQRKSPRLKNFNYSNRYSYFVTICTQNKIKVLSRIKNNKVYLTDEGVVVDKYINLINKKYPTAKVLKYVVMPNHIHLIISLISKEQPIDLNKVIGWFKYYLTKEINTINKNPYKKVFQRSYFDHIIRGKEDFEKIWNYISNNPYLWNRDCFYK